MKASCCNRYSDLNSCTSTQPANGLVPQNDVTEKIRLGNASPPSQSRPPGGTNRDKAKGNFHYMIAASKPNKQFCRAIVSSTVNRYGPPIIAGWHGEGELDAAETHLAKVRAVSNYLDNLTAEADDDLFMLIDGYDVQLQLGADVLIQRYFEVVAKEDQRLIRQLGPTNAERIAGPLGRHIMFGADKVCFPVDWQRPACWAVPEVPDMDSRMFGPKTDGGDLSFFRPRWLNSGTIMGPVKETREFFHATLAMINATYNLDYEFHESDQYYMGEVWGLQELDRINKMLAIDPKAKYPERSKDAQWPKLKKDKRYNFHVAMDYWSHLFQTWAGYGEWVDWRRFDGPGYSSTIDKNVREEDKFRPWDLTLDGDAMTSVDRIFRSTDDSSLPKTSDKLLQQSEFGSNIITKTTLAVFHCTGAKDPLDVFFPRMWFHKYARPLIRSAVAFLRNDEAYAPFPMNGRMWYPAKTYPDAAGPDDGGAWSDGSDPSGEMAWLEFDSMCKEFESDLF